MTHPPGSKLDALAAGDADPDTRTHVDGCAPCAAYVAELSRGAAAFRRAADPRGFVASVAEGRGRRVLPARPRGIAWAAPVLAAAAAIVLWLRAPTSPRLPETPPADSAALSDRPRFKGEKVVAAVRERAGRQERLMGPFSVRAGDRVRVEVGVDREGPVTAGLLGADGTWTLLLPATVLEAGVHYSDLAARFDDDKTEALLLVGSPEAVDRARRTRNLRDVVAWTVTSEPPR